MDKEYGNSVVEEDKEGYCDDLDGEELECLRELAEQPELDCFVIAKIDPKTGRWSR